MSKIVYSLAKLQEFFYYSGLVFLSKLISVFVRIVFSCQISPGAKFGKNCVFGYAGLGTVIHGSVVVGDDVTFGSNVTVGGNFGKGGVPQFGNNVYVSTGAKIFGPVRVGDNSIIAANAVVLHDVPANCVYGGVPGKVIRFLEGNEHG